MSALAWQYKSKNKTHREDHVPSKLKPSRRTPAIQAKLTVGQPNDIYEQEADRLADRVMRMTEGSLVSPDTGSLVNGDSSSVQRKAGCPGCPEEAEMLQAKSASSNTPAVTPGIESSINSLKGGGQPLSQSTRAFFEPRFGIDFSQVRVHTGDRAAQTAQSIQAKAFTTGNNILFNSGQYSPESSSGKLLLAHELTHVVQQDIQGSQIKREIDETIGTGETTTVDNSVKQEVLDTIIYYFREYPYPYIEQNNIGSVSDLAEAFADVVAEYRRENFELDEESEAEEREAVTNFVKRRYSIYWWDKDYYYPLFLEALGNLKDRLKWYVYRIYD
jgi:Domain of unknown function (DUF4157)